jgi:hypothetical protein
MRVIFAPPEDEGDEDGGDGEEQESNSDDEKVFVVQEVSFEHTGGCKPGAAQQRVLTRVSTAGCKVPVHVLQKLSECMRMHPDTRQIRRPRAWSPSPDEEQQRR